MAWTPEKIKQLKKLWQKGKSTVEIGKELGMSKNAVVGKVHRLELDARPSPIKKAVNTPQKANEKSNQPVGLLDLRINSCRWPIGELKDDDFHFCGKECQTGKPYCPEHCKIAYTSLKELTMQNAKNKKDRASLTVVSLEETNDKEKAVPAASNGKSSEKAQKTTEQAKKTTKKGTTKKASKSEEE